MKNEFGFEPETFQRACENALNSLSREALTEEEWEIHRQWVADNWEDLNTGEEA